MSFVAIRNVLKAYGLAREAYLQEHPQKRLFPTIERTARAVVPREPIITPGPKLQEAGRNLWLFLLVGLVLAAVLKD